MIGNETRKTAIALKSKGFTYKQIGEYLNVLPQYAGVLVRPLPPVQVALHRKYGKKCAHCGEPSGKHGLHIHHIGLTAEPWMFNSLDNLLLLCRSCHAQEHKRIKSTL